MLSENILIRINLFLLCIVIGALPAYIIRHMIIKKQIAMWISFTYSFVVFIIITGILRYIEVKSLIAGAVALASYFILRKEPKEEKT